MILKALHHHYQYLILVKSANILLHFKEGSVSMNPDPAKWCRSEFRELTATQKSGPIALLRRPLVPVHDQLISVRPLRVQLRQMDINNLRPLQHLQIIPSPRPSFTWHLAAIEKMLPIMSSWFHVSSLATGVYILVRKRYLFPPPLMKIIFFPPLATRSFSTPIVAFLP